MPKAKKNPWSAAQKRKHPRGPRGQFLPKGGARKSHTKHRARRNPVAAAPPRRPAAPRSNPWYGNSAGHARAARKESSSERSRAAKKGWARRRRAGTAPRRNPWYGQPTKHRAAAKKGWETRRKHATTRARTEKRARKHVTRGMTMGRNETLIIRSNPMGMLGTVLGAVVMGGIGYAIADTLDRYIATRAPKGTTEPLKGPAAATAIQHLNWGRVAIEAALSVAGVAGGLYMKKGMARTAVISFGLGAGVKAGADIISKALVPALFGGARSADGTLPNPSATGNRLFADLIQNSSIADSSAKSDTTTYGGLRGAPTANGSGQASGCGAGCACDGTSTCACNDCKARRMATDVWNRLQQTPAIPAAPAAPHPAAVASPGATGMLTQPAGGLAGARSDFDNVLNMGLHTGRKAAAR